MHSFSLVGILAASFVFICLATGENVVEREKRDDNEWIVTTLIEQPYVIKKRDPATSNEDYEGYIPDMLKKISEKLNQKYRIREVPDKKYGIFDSKRNSWSGLIGEITSSRADLAAAPITMNDQRANVVDFTIPFMTFGTVVILRKPSNASVPAPKTVHDLLEQSNLRYGVVNDGTTEQLIRASSDADLARMQDRLDELETQENGVNRVRSGQGKHTFVIEEKTANFWKRQEPCDLITIPVTQLGKRDYALALKKNSPHTKKVNEALRELKDSGELEALEKKWWSGPCSAGVGMTSGLVTVAAALGVVVRSIMF